MTQEPEDLHEPEDLQAPEDLLDERATGKFIGKPAPTLRDWRYRGIGPPYVKVGPKSVRYRRRDIEAWLEANTVRPGAA